MAGSSRFNTWLYTIKLQHCPMKKVGVLLHQFHWFKLFQYCFFTHFIFCFSAFFFKMACICNVAYVPYFVSFVGKIPVHNIKRNVRTGMAKMTFATNRGAAYIHTGIPRGNRFKNFFLTGVRVVNF